MQDAARSTTCGSRAAYQRGCKCLRCRVANARYQTQYRSTRRVGGQPLGARISAREAAQRIKQLQIEKFTQRELARRIGLGPKTRLRLRSDVITVANAIRIRRLYARVMLGGEAPR